MGLFCCVGACCFTSGFFAFEINSVMSTLIIEINSIEFTVVCATAVVVLDTIRIVDDDVDVVATVVGSAAELWVSFAVTETASLELLELLELPASVVSVVVGAGVVTVVFGTSESTTPTGRVMSMFASGQSSSSG